MIHPRLLDNTIKPVVSLDKKKNLLLIFAQSCMKLRNPVQSAEKIGQEGGFGHEITGVIFDWRRAAG